MEIEINNAATAILFAILFISVGWVAPAAYTSYAPQDHFIEVHEFSAENTTTETEVHEVTLDRTIRDETTGTIYTELYLIDKEGNRVEVDSNKIDRYLQDGRSTVKTPMDLPDNLATGDYRYVMVIEMELSQGRVTRQFEFVSEPFLVREATNSTNTTERFK